MRGQAGNIAARELLPDEDASKLTPPRQRVPGERCVRLDLNLRVINGHEYTDDSTIDFGGVIGQQRVVDPFERAVVVRQRGEPRVVEQIVNDAFGVVQRLNR